MPNVSELEPLDELAQRYLLEKMAAPARFPEFRIDEIDRIREFVRSKFRPEEMGILYVYDQIEGEWVSGHRCGVCGMTSAQSRAANYDCSNEC